MYIISNALENLLRNKSRNILVISIMFAIIATTVVSLIINNTSSAVIEDYKTRFSSQVSITPNMEKLQQEAIANSSSGRGVSLRVPQISPEQYLAFALSEALQRADAFASVSANSKSMTALDQSEDEEEPDLGPSGMSMSGSSVAGAAPMMSMRGGGNYRLFGDYWDEFNAGTRSLLDDGISRMPSANNECLISEDLANLNKLKVGDKLTVQVQMSVEIPADTDMSNYGDGDSYRKNGTTYALSVGPDGRFQATRIVDLTMTVVGIYLDLNDPYDNENLPQIAALNHRNEILTTLDTLLALRATDENNIMLNVTYHLKSPDLLEAFEADVRAAGLSDIFDVSTDSSSYDMIVRPVVGLKNITLSFMAVVVALGAIILILLTSIAIRERKYEIGVLRAMGMKKSKVSLGLWSELLIMTGIALVVGIGVGLLAAQPITDVLISQQAQAAASSVPSGTVTTGAPQGAVTIGMGSLMGPGGRASNAAPLSEMDISIGLLTIVEIIGIALLLATLAGLVSTSRITKYEPIVILMERN